MKKLFAPYLCGTKCENISFPSFPRKSPRSKNRGLALLSTWMILFFVPYGFGAETVLLEEDFSGLVNTPPDAAKFDWDGEVKQNGSGQLVFNTLHINQSWLRSKASATLELGQTLVLQFRASTYAENPRVYGDLQPRGLRVGNDADNVVEFYSISAVNLGMRVRKDGVESLASYSLPSRVDTMHDYEIAVTATSIIFMVDGLVTGTIVNNIPVGELNAYISTYDGGFGQVPITLDNLSFVLRDDPNTILLEHFEGSTAGTEYGSVSFTNSVQGLDQSVHLPTGAYVKFPFAGWTGSSGGTLDMWIKPNQHPAYLMDWNWYNTTTQPGSGHVLSLNITTEGKLHYGCWPYASELPLGQTTIPTNEWTHVGVTWGAGGTTLYVNGQPDGYTSVNAWPSINQTIYAYLNYWGANNLGCVDELRISNIDRSPESMWSYYSSMAPAVVTVASNYGSPDPAIGSHPYAMNSAVTCSVSSVVADGGTNYICTGWTGTGSIPASGTSNSTESISLTHAASSITWNWEISEYWMETDTLGNGAIIPSTNWYAAGTNLAVSAVPDSGWLFTGWSGDLSGDYTASNTALLVNSAKTITATFSDDADDDGLLNTNEWAIGTNPRKSDTDGDGFDDGFEVAENLSPTNDSSSVISYITNNQSTFGLYTEEQLGALALGDLMIQSSNAEIRVCLQLMKSNDLTTWTNANEAIWWSMPSGDKEFYKVRAEP